MILKAGKLKKTSILLEEGSNEFVKTDNRSFKVPFREFRGVYAIATLWRR